MRHRFRVSLYDDSDLDKDILDFLSGSSRKQEMLRTFIRAGYAMVINKQDTSLAYLESMEEDQKAAFAYMAMQSRESLAHPAPRSTGNNTSQFGDDDSTRASRPTPGNPVNKRVDSSLPDTREASIYDIKAEAPKITERDKDESSDISSDSDPVDFMSLLQD